jgi:hypothetical protein
LRAALGTKDCVQDDKERLIGRGGRCVARARRRRSNRACLSRSRQHVARDVRLAARGIHATIEDFGCWRPPASAETRGRGIPIMRAIANGMEIQTRSDSTKISLYFARP